MNIPVFKKAENALVSAQRFIGVLLAFVAASLVVYQVILRYVFKAPLMGIEELLMGLLTVRAIAVEIKLLLYEGIAGSCLNIIQ